MGVPKGWRVTASDGLWTIHVNRVQVEIATKTAMCTYEQTAGKLFGADGKLIARVFDGGVLS